jgi:hypothetical protein
MRLQREKDVLVLTLNHPERVLLAQALRELAGMYRLTPDELDPRTAAAWYSCRGCATAGMSDAETKEWLEHLHALRKGTRLLRLEEWTAQLGNAAKEPSTLRIATEHAPVFMTAINDYRLAAAARHDIGQAEMDAHFPWQLAKLPAPRQHAVLEIHFLAWLIEETLRALDAA